ncbi:dTDP-4-dehydrorhamnose reductase [Neorhizobium sp. DT-125]|uniref:dTDP-4-dehydrorhamnose reductase n=1 Tax=Neorhizobium sp. DT-125 TaxID=3396163 RepID=UPI003F1A8206
MTRRRIAVTGVRGQLVSALLERGKKFPNIDVIALGRPTLDLAVSDGIAASILEVGPDAIISAAAYTAVDQAESESQLAMIINGEAPGILGAVASQIGIPIVHISTDYVFDGSKNEPYVETDPTSPLGVYGRSKLMGEIALAAATDNYAILRVAWLYSPHGRNFLKTMLELAGKRNAVSVVNDQLGNPTSALDVADGVLAVALNLISNSAQSLRGTFHMAAQGSATWAEFAAEIYKISKCRGGPFAAVSPISSREYPTAALRPSNSRLDSSKLERVHGLKLPAWPASTVRVVERLVSESELVRNGGLK